MSMLSKAVLNISEPMRTAVKLTVIELNKKAEQTPNPWDNILVAFLCATLGIEIEEKKEK